MTIIMVSSMFQSGRDDLARILAKKTDWPVLTRDELIEQARQAGVKIGRLEMAMIKKPGLSEKLAREKELYLAFITATICERARDGNLIYSGRAGHLLLPGVGHRLRVGLTAPWEIRVRRTARALNLSPDKAEAYLWQLDEDVNRWIRFVHHTDSRDPSQFDVSFNLENIGLSNAAGVLCEMAELPDFQPTPASRKQMQDLYLASQAKLALAKDERTREAELQIQSHDGFVTVTYPPHQSEISQSIPAVLANLEDCKGIECTMAETNILWVQERFDPKSDTFHDIIQLSQRWGAAVELLRLIPPDEEQTEMLGQANESAASSDFGRQECAVPYTGGVEDDEPAVDIDDGGLAQTREALVDLGRAGGQHSVCGEYDKILAHAHGNGHYALVIIGEMFLSKGHSTRTRQTRELILNIRDRLKAPVINVDELKSKFLFGPRQAVSLAVLVCLTALIYTAAFHYQDPILNLLGGTLHQDHKWSSSILVAAFVPFIAYIYGTVAELILKFINID